MVLINSTSRLTHRIPLGLPEISRKYFQLESLDKKSPWISTVILSIFTPFQKLIICAIKLDKIAYLSVIYQLSVPTHQQHSSYLECQKYKQFIVGAGLITIGSLFLSGASELPSDYDFAPAAVLPVLTIVLGSIIFVVSFFGCCGAIKENSCMLTTYTIFLIILCILQIAFSSYVWATRQNLYDEAEVYVQQGWDNRKDNQKVLDAIQILGRCCGKDNKSDYGLEPLPASCCGSANEQDKCPANQAYDTGCFSGFKDYFSAYTNWIIVYGYIIAAIELAGVILACCLKGTLNRHRRTY
uniref:Uncharacterized protein n=1 Tax=Megaselia scalaris TaxID=36166 RepID=T1GQV1_MEGSC